MLNTIEIEEELNCMITIVDRDYNDKITNLFLEENVRFNIAILGKGTAHDDILEYLGLEKSEKSIIVTLLKVSSAKKIQNVLLEKHNLNTPGHGISFIIPINKIGGVKFKETLKKRGELMNSDFKYELIIAISNKGTGENVTNAAKSINKSIGGTIMHGRGLGHKEVEKFLGITISPEKEIIMILTKKEDTSDLMKEILHQAGPQTQSRAIVFSLPVTEAIGMSTLS